MLYECFPDYVSFGLYDMLVAVYILLKGDCILPLCLEEGSGKFL
jgi:hypothetical protein